MKHNEYIIDCIDRANRGEITSHRECGDCDKWFDRMVLAQQNGHIVIETEKDFAIIIGCEGYHEFR